MTSGVIHMGTYNTTFVLITSLDSLSLVQSENKILSAPSCSTIDNVDIGVRGVEKTVDQNKDTTISNPSNQKRFLSQSEDTMVNYHQFLLFNYLFNIIYNILLLMRIILWKP